MQGIYDPSLWEDQSMLVKRLVYDTYPSQQLGQYRNIESHSRYLRSFVEAKEYGCSQLSKRDTCVICRFCTVGTLLRISTHR